MGISTHILDTASGKPATGVSVTLEHLVDGAWVQLNQAVTDADGRCKHLLPLGNPVQPGIYRIHFATSSYYAAHKIEGLYPYVEIVFEITDSEQHYHVPLLLTANGYTTYRGS